MLQVETDRAELMSSSVSVIIAVLRELGSVMLNLTVKTGLTSEIAVSHTTI